MTIGLFAPLPLAMMIPFMAGQSLMMGEAFGKGFQYGKRKISSMSNEEFNALTPSDLGKSITTDYNAIIPHLGKAVQQSSDFQSLVIKEIIDVIKKLPGDIVQGFTQTSDTSTSAIDFGQGGTLTDVRRGSGTTFNEDAIQDTLQGIEDAARAYMEWSGLADFEQAKETIRNMIKAKKEDFTKGFQQPTGTVNIRAPGLSGIGSKIQQVRAAAAANKIRVQENIKNLAPLIQNKRQEIANLIRYKPSYKPPTRSAGQSIRSYQIATNRAKATFGNRVGKYLRGLKILQNQLADLQKKLQNALTQLRNL